MADHAGVKVPAAGEPPRMASVARRTGAPKQPLPVALTLVIGAALNALFGLLGYFPYIYGVLLGNGIAGELGWSRPTQLFRDGVWHVVVFVLVLWAVYLAVAVLSNRALLRRSAVRGWRYWALCLPLLLLPSCVAAFRYGLVIS